VARIGDYDDGYPDHDNEELTRLVVELTNDLEDAAEHIGKAVNVLQESNNVVGLLSERLRAAREEIRCLHDAGASAYAALSGCLDVVTDEKTKQEIEVALTLITQSRAPS